MSPSLDVCWPQVYRFALSLTRDRHLAEDLAQDTMTRACSRVDQLRSSAALSSWLLRIAANLWKDRLRRPFPPQTTVDVELVESVSAPVDQMSRGEEVAMTLSVMQALPDKQRAVLHLYAVEEMTVPEIAEVLDMKPATARVHLSLARRSLRTRLPQLWEEIQRSGKPNSTNE